MRKVRYDLEVTVHVQVYTRLHVLVRAYMRTCLPCVHTGIWTAYYSPPPRALGSRSARDYGGFILKINLGALSCLPSPAENFRPV